MARRSDHTREELTEMAISNAIALLDKEGAAAFSVRKTAAAIGYTVGTLYNVFGNMDHFVLRINAALLDEWRAYLENAVKIEDGHPVERLASAYTTFVRNHYNRWKFLFDYNLTQETSLPPWYKEKIRRLFDLAEQVILPFAGHDAAKAAEAARILWAGIHGICVLSLSGKLETVENAPEERMVQSLIRYTLNGIAPENA